MGKRPIQNSDCLRKKREKFWKFSQTIFRFYFYFSLMFFHCFIEHKNVAIHPPPLFPPTFNIIKKKKKKPFLSLPKLFWLFCLSLTFETLYKIFLDYSSYKTMVLKPCQFMNLINYYWNFQMTFFLLVGGKSIKAKTSYQIKVPKKRKVGFWIYL